MKTPGPDHPITIQQNPKRVRVIFNGRTIADTRRALTLREATLPAVQYIPREETDMTVLKRTTHTSHCPYKGDAVYFSIRVEDKSTENAVWSYETPYPAVDEIKDYVAFYSDRVDAVEEIS
jgi:uncharacterized protein (DUF427 family)